MTSFGAYLVIASVNGAIMGLSVGMGTKNFYLGMAAFQFGTFQVLACMCLMCLTDAMKNKKP